MNQIRGSLQNIIYNFNNVFRGSTIFFKNKYETHSPMIPEAKSLPIIGTKFDLLLAGGGTMLHEYIDKRHKQFGSIFSDKLGGPTKIVFVSDPELIKLLFINLEGKYPSHILPDPWVLYHKLYGNKRGLFFMENEEWLNNRRIMNKLLLRETCKYDLRIPVEETIQNCLMKWKENCDQGKLIPNLESEFYRLSIDVVLSCFIGKNTCLKPSKHYEELIATFSESVKKIFQTTTKLYNLPLNICYRLNLKIWQDFKQSVDISLFLAQKIINEIIGKQNNRNEGLIGKMMQENMSNESIVKIAADLIIAAGDTSAYTLLWTLELLSNHQDVVSLIRVKGRSYVKHVIKESMRLYPVAPFLTRILPQNSQFKCYQLEKGTPVIASIYTSGRENLNFSKADQFLPYRWDRNDIRKEELPNHVLSASLPFALGARSCVGRQIAMLQLTETVYQIVMNFDIKPLNKTKVKAITSQVLVPDKPIEVEFTLRKSK